MGAVSQPAVVEARVNRHARVAILAAIALVFTPPHAQAAPASRPARAPGSATTRAFAGTWTGSSKCVGGLPACKDETVVYRFVPLAGHPRQLRMLADKILEGQRVPMGALVCDVDATGRAIRCEFARGRTHIVWSYVAAGDSLRGTLLLLPDSTIGRDVHAHRVADAAVPAAPPLRDYDE